MTILNDSLRLYLTFRNELKQVEVLVATNRFDGPPLCIMGVVEGEEGLEDLLATVGIDHFLIASGDAFTPSFTCTAYARSPKRIVESLIEAFTKADEIPLKILRGEKLTDDEESFRAPVSLTVCASAVQMGQGAESAATWFKKKAGNNQAQSAAR